MRIPFLILRELLHRKGNALLTLIAVVTAVTLYVGFVTTGTAADRETSRLMRDLGFNLRLIPKQTDELAFWDRGYAEETMPEEYIQRFAEKQGLSYRHLVATLQQWTPLGDANVLLTGIAPEVSPPDGKKPPMIFEVDPGSVYIGYNVAARLGIGEGDTVTLGGETFTVARTLVESGSDKDARVYGNIRDVQRVLGQAGRINEIQALECLCRDPNVESIDILRAELAELMPEAKVIQLADKAKAREKQRLMSEGYFALMIQFVVVVCALWIGILAWLNVRERRHEIGIFRALGFGSTTIAALVIGKALVIGFIGAGIGFGAGTLLALQVGPDLFPVTASKIEPVYPLLRQALVAAPVFAALSSLIPAAIAVSQDPATTLREE
jgi:ABC-type lipoprotein release transport system permease subunit